MCVVWQSLKDEAEAERGRTREILQGIKAEKKAAELELVEVSIFPLGTRR